MRPLSPELQQVIRHILTQEGRQSLDSRELVSAVERVYEQFARRLAPVISEAGVYAILTRSAKLTQAEFPFIKWSPGMISRAGSRIQIWEDFNGQERAMAWKASEALLTTFAGLVVSLIGERLAWRLLFDLSPEVFSSAPPQESTE
jgi:hypothetical protein